MRAGRGVASAGLIDNRQDHEYKGIWCRKNEQLSNNLHIPGAVFTGDTDLCRRTIVSLILRYSLLRGQMPRPPLGQFGPSGVNVPDAKSLQALIQEGNTYSACASTWRLTCDADVGDVSSSRDFCRKIECSLRCALD